jgi:hypothetical protein
MSALGIIFLASFAGACSYQAQIDQATQLAESSAQAASTATNTANNSANEASQSAKAAQDAATGAEGSVHRANDAVAQLEASFASSVTK